MELQLLTISHLRVAFGIYPLGGKEYIIFYVDFPAYVPLDYT
jgi:hypothetical protein